MCTFKVNKGDEGRILFLINELLQFITERGASFFIAEDFLIWDMNYFSYSKQTNTNEVYNLSHIQWMKTELKY